MRTSTTTKEETVVAPARESNRALSTTWLLFACATAIKLVIMMLFSSGYQDDLFVPFVRHFLENWDNPWNYFLQNSAHGDEFPYQPIMLYVVALFCLPLKFLGWDNLYLTNLVFKLPTLASDFAVTLLLLKLFPHRARAVFWLYFCSPIILYACYMHAQLDLIPTALLFTSIYFLRHQKWILHSFLFGLALSTKAHVAAAAPLIATFLTVNRQVRAIFLFVGISALVYICVVAPYFESAGFRHLVLQNAKQAQIFEVFFPVGQLRIYLPVFAVLLSYGRFALYPKINFDLLDAFLTIVFGIFILLTYPSPGWYVWMTPFLQLLAIKYYRKHRSLIASVALLNVCYLVYFGLFHNFDHIAIKVAGQAFPQLQFSEHLRSAVFTVLEVALFSNLILFYRAGVRSNSIYQRDRALVIGIAGDSGSGKSTVLGDITSILKQRTVQVEGDADHRWERGDEHWQELTHLDPKSNYLHRQANSIMSLKRGSTVKRADYDHSTGRFTTPKLLHPQDFILVSGLHTFYLPKMRKLIDLKIFMDTDPSLQKHWKVQRDTNERGYSSAQIDKQMERRSTDASKHIAPQKNFADISIRYFGEEPYDDQNTALAITLSSSLELDDFVEILSQTGSLESWNYHDDLARQELVLTKPVPASLLKSMASELIPNVDEIVVPPVEWLEGHRGLVQLIIILALSDLMKENEQSRVV